MTADRAAGRRRAGGAAAGAAPALAERPAHVGQRGQERSSPPSGTLASSSSVPLSNHFELDQRLGQERADDRAGGRADRDQRQQPRPRSSA